MKQPRRTTIRRPIPPAAFDLPDLPLREAFHRVAAIVDSTEDAVTIRDAAGASLYLNASGRASLGAPEAALLGFGDAPARPDLALMDATVLETARGVEAEVTLAPDGQDRHFHVFKRPYLAPDGALAGVITISRDISRRKALEATLTAQNEQLRTLDLMKTDFVNTVSHELRTPLTSIVAYAEFLEDRIGGDLSDTQAEFLGHILDASRHLRRLVDDLLDFACSGERALRLFREEADLRAAMAEAIDALAPQAAKRRQTLLLDLPAEPVRVHIDSSRIGQVVSNLVGNAIKFTPQGGTIVLRVRPGADGPLIEVIDEGIGIADRDLPHLFDRFYQVDNSTTRTSGGAGLGLYISRAIVEAHGGTLHVESGFGEGSRFWFTLPVEAPQRAGELAIEA